jgi:hypothetical protein
MRAWSFVPIDRIAPSPATHASCEMRPACPVLWRNPALCGYGLWATVTPPALFPAANRRPPQLFCTVTGVTPGACEGQKPLTAQVYGFVVVTHFSSRNASGVGIVTPLFTSV